MISRDKWDRVGGNISYGLLLLSAIMVPLVVDTRLGFPHSMPKQYAVWFFGLALLMVATAIALLTRRITFVSSKLDWAMGVLAGAHILVAIVSLGGSLSWFGRGSEFSPTVAWLLGLIIMYYLVLRTITTPLRWQRLLDCLVGVGLLTALLALVRLIFAVDLLGMIGLTVWNTFDITNSNFGVWLIIIFVLTASQALSPLVSGWRLACYVTAAITTALTALLLQFAIVWWLLVIAIVGVLFLGISLVRYVRLAWISTLFGLLLLVAMVIGFGLPRLSLNPPPAEISLNFLSSWNITRATVQSGLKEFALGSGWGTFGADFSKFRDINFNSNPLAWSLRFHQPFNSALALLAEGGVAGLVAVLALIAATVAELAGYWLKNRNGKAREVGRRNASLNPPPVSIPLLGLGITWLVLTAAGALLFLGAGLWWLWWLLLALLMTGLGLAGRGVITWRVVVIDDAPEKNVMFSFGILIVAAFIVLAGIGATRGYAAEHFYSKAIRSTDAKERETLLGKALLWRSDERFNIALAETYLNQAIALSQSPNPSRAAVGDRLASAINAAREATNRAPWSVALWESLALMYENAIPLVPEAREWALSALKAAEEREPTNPLIVVRLAAQLAAAGQTEAAEEKFNRVLALKKDFVDPYIGLALLLESKGASTRALEILTNGLNALPGNTEILYHYARLLYNRSSQNDRAAARQIWESIVSVQPSHANTLYSLGLWWEASGAPGRALDYYEQVQNINPANQELINKISALRRRLAPDTAEKKL